MSYNHNDDQLPKPEDLENTLPPDEKQKNAIHDMFEDPQKLAELNATLDQLVSPPNPIQATKEQTSVKVQKVLPPKLPPSKPTTASTVQLDVEELPKR